MKTAARTPPPRSDDERLRAWGYSIAARPRDGLALWFTPGRRGIVTVAQALAAIAACVRSTVKEEAHKTNRRPCRGR